MSNKGRLALLAVALLPLASVPAASVAALLEPDEEAVFLPGTARQTASDQFEIDIHAWLCEREHRWGLNTVFARYLGLNLSKLSPVARLRFSQRTALFHAGSEGNKAIDIVFDGNARRHTLPPTRADGRSDARLLVEAPMAPGQQWLHFHAAPAPGEPHRFKGQALIVPAQGLSVISDIDDTIKHTQVRNRREMLLNTFARHFEAVPGMAARYRAMAEVPGTRFHYLSASPIQLYPALAEFLRSAGFPAGTMHLRESTTWRTLVPGEHAAREHKLAVIRRLLADFPERRFMLVGDSGEADPEVYAAVAREHPGRIDAIVIRDVTGESRSAERYRATFEGFDAARWHILSADAAWPAAAMPIR
jgi:hypothetical protein